MRKRESQASKATATNLLGMTTEAVNKHCQDEAEASELGFGIMWPNKRAEELTQKTKYIFSKPRVRYTFIPSDETSSINYFSTRVIHELGTNSLEQLEYIPYTNGLNGVDIIITSCHGSDLSENLWTLKLIQGTETIVASWLWDNHLAMVNNLKTAAASDFVFPSHQYASSYLSGPCSCLFEHIPSCTAQWTRTEAIDLFEKSSIDSRSGRLLANYVNYSWAWRSGILKDLQSLAPEVEVRLLPADDRRQYFDKSSSHRFATWLRNKATLILPIDRDLSTRVFDALLAGQVLVVPKIIEDFDDVIDRKTQEGLGIIRINDLEIDTIRKAAVLAEAVFDQQGEDGAFRRHSYALDNHMLENRIELILESLKKAARPDSEIVFNGILCAHLGR